MGAIQLSHNNYRVLLVDDEPIILRSLEVAIPWDELHITRIDKARNGEEALQIFHEQHPDIIISDIRMPSINGISLMSEVMQVNPDLVFIVISGYGEFEYAMDSINYGAAGYILKPIDHDELTDMLKKAIGKLNQNRLAQQRSELLLDSIQSLSLLARERMFAELIEGNQRPLQHMRWLEDNILQDPYYICVVQLDHFTTMNKKWDEKEKRLWFFAVRNILEEWSKNNSVLAAFPFHSGEWILIFADATSQEQRKNGDEIVQHIMQYTKLSCSVGISTPVQGIEELHRAYQSAYDALHQRFYWSFEHVFIDSSPSDQHFLVNQSWQYPKWVEKEILRKIRSLDLYGIQQLLDKMKQELEASGVLKDLLIRYIVEITVISRREFEHMNLKIESTVEHLIQNLLEAATLDEAIETLKAAFSCWITDNLEQQASDNGPALISKAKHYIDNHYHNDIGIDEVSDYVGLSASHFCTLFKQVSDSTFLEYVTQCRIEKAKYILKNTEVKVYQLAPLVGYQDSKYFTQVFKKLTAMTPSEYRMHQEI